MRKRDELNNPNSCMSKAADNEMTFVLLGRDIAAPAAIRAWCAERVRMGKNTIEDPQIGEALDCARAMESTCHICGRETGGVVCCTATPAPPPPDLRAECLAVLRDVESKHSVSDRLLALIERLEAAVGFIAPDYVQNLVAAARAEGFEAGRDAAAEWTEAHGYTVVGVGIRALKMEEPDAV